MRRLALVLLASLPTSALFEGPPAKAEAPITAATTAGPYDTVPRACCPPMTHYRPRTSLVPEMLRSVEGF